MVISHGFANQRVAVDNIGIARRPRALEAILRVGACLCFVGHGAFGIMTKEAWVRYFAVANIGRDRAFDLMPLIGTLDITPGIAILFRPVPLAAAWMILWAVWTAMLRPLSGEPLWEAFERAGNYGVPAALFILMHPPRSFRDLFQAAEMRPLSPTVVLWIRRVLTATVALLLLGHGMLGVIGKPGLVTNYASVVSADAAAAMTPIIGWCEIALAGLVAVRQGATLLIGIAIWKLATESLFLSAGAPAWELVERGGSYAAPIALALLVIMTSAKNPVK
jgi:hypothetical protein